MITLFLVFYCPREEKNGGIVLGRRGAIALGSYKQVTFGKNAALASYEDTPIGAEFG